jgi:hypothetical protein
VLGRGGCPSGQTVVKEAAVSTRGRLLHATTDWRFLCRPISSIPAVRQLSAGKSVGRSDFSPGSPRGEEGGKLREQRLRAESARVVRRSAPWRRPTRAGESARTRWGERARKRARRISRPVYSKCTREHTGLEEKALRARWGAHKERVEADA